MKKIWIVSKSNHDESGSWVIILGVYDNERDAIARVSEVALEVEEGYEEVWGTKFDGQDHMNGYAKFEATDGYSETEIKAIRFDLNKGDYFLID